jgi:cyclophilin family peptidyl-prolyl cis-trans isomerase/HEAT repeat protein
MRAGLVLLALCCCTQAFAQNDPETLKRQREEKIEVILRIKDRRTLHDGKLLSLLSDADPVVRRKAFLAYGSIQDSTALGVLTQGLSDPDRAVQTTAAFALGQTGSLLSPASRAALEHDLLWNRLQGTDAQDELIEEIGKFGTQDGLQDLVIRFGSEYPRVHEHGLTMAIARFAIRGITDASAVRYLLAGLRMSAQPAWETMYALQRVGDNPESKAEIEHLALIRESPDPLVRMHLATLLGKLRDQRVAREPLIRLASYDGDWRVRVNAYRALATFSLANDGVVLDLFRRALYDGTTSVALAAIAALKSSDITVADTAGSARELLRHLEAMVTNRDDAFAWQYQAEAATTLATLLRAAALPFFPDVQWPNLHLRADMLRALGSTGNPAAEKTLLAALDESDAITQAAALEGLAELARLNSTDTALRKTIRSQLPRMCETKDVAVVAAAAGMMADSLFADDRSTTELLNLIPSLQGADDTEALLEVIGALGELRDTRAVLPLLDLFSHAERPVAVQAAAALQQITGRDYAGKIGNREPFFTDFDFSYLRTLPDTIRVQFSTTRGDITAVLYKDLAPFTIMSMLKLSSQRGFYRGLSFHRVVPNFVVQGGCPRGDGWGGPGYTLRSEFSPALYLTGTIGIASAGKDTEGSQFFITHSPQPHLDGRYTVIGRVIEGQSVVDAIQRDERLYDIRVE